MVAEDREERRSRGLIKVHLESLRRWSPDRRREFLIEIGVIDVLGCLTPEFGGGCPLYDQAGRMIWGFGDQ